MENEKENKFLFILAVTLLAVLAAMIFIKTFMFDKSKEEKIDVPESLIDELYSYIDIKNLNNEISFYVDNYINSQNLGYTTIAKMTYNYINKYDNLKIESVNDTDKSLFKEDGTLLNKIKINDFEEDVNSVISKSNFGLNEHFNKFDIDENTSAYIKGEYLFIYKRNEPIDSNYVSYRGLISYTLLDNANKIQLTEYYLICDKISKICYDSNNEEKNTYITYSEDLNVSTMIDKLKKYVHTFEKIGEKYKWISVEGL